MVENFSAMKIALKFCCGSKRKLLWDTPKTDNIPLYVVVVGADFVCMPMYAAIQRRSFCRRHHTDLYAPKKRSYVQKNTFITHNGTKPLHIFLHDDFVHTTLPIGSRLFSSASWPPLHLIYLFYTPFAISNTNSFDVCAFFIRCCCACAFLYVLRT